jgi:hypothetical protein
MGENPTIIRKLVGKYGNNCGLRKMYNYVLSKFYCYMR